MRTTVTINWAHVVLLGRFARWWGVYVVGCLILGWGLNPRLDEVLFVTFLPVPFVAAYAVLCLLVAWLRVLIMGGVGAPAAPYRTESSRPPAPPRATEVAPDKGAHSCAAVGVPK